MKCTTHDRDLECMAGCSAHPSNWYCPECDKDELIAELEAQAAIDKDFIEQYQRQVKELEAELRKTVLGYETENKKLREALEQIIPYLDDGASEGDDGAILLPIAKAALEVKDG